MQLSAPRAITRHGVPWDYIPAPGKRSEAASTALKEAPVRLPQVLTAEGISEEEILHDPFKPQASMNSCTTALSF